MADRIVVFRDGRIEQVGAPLDIYRRPANQFVAGFIGSPRMNFLTGRHASAHDAATIGIRPEHLRIEPQGTLNGVVRTVEYLGNEALVHVELDEGALVTVRLSEASSVRPEEKVALAMASEQVHRFNNDGIAQAA